MQLVTTIGPDVGSLVDPSQFQGRTVATVEWLIAYLAYGKADAVHLLVFEPSQIQSLERELARYGVRAGRTFSAHVEALPELLKRLPEPVFFHKDPAICRAKAAVRAMSPDRVIPVAGMTHTLSTEGVLEQIERIALDPPDPCDALVCTSRAAQSVVSERWKAVLGAAAEARFPPVDLRVIPLGVFPDRHTAGASSVPLPTIPPDRPVVLSHGRLTLLAKMDLTGLIECWPEVLRRSKRRPVLVLSGAAHPPTLDIYAARIHQLGLDDDVRILVDVSEAERTALYQRASVFCTPVDNLQETFGLSVVEAMAAGCAVVASDWDGYRDLVDDGVEGFLIPAYWGSASRVASGLGWLSPDTYRALVVAQQVAVDLDLLTDRLVKLVDDEELCRAMGARGKARARSRFDWRVVIEAYDELFAAQRARAANLAAESATSPRLLADSFRSFPTHMVGDDDRFVLTERGQRVVSGREAPFVYLPRPWHEEVLRRLELPRGAEGGTVGAALRGFGSDWAARERGLAMILWLVKRGFARLVPASRASGG